MINSVHIDLTDNEIIEEQKFKFSQIEPSIRMKMKEKLDRCQN